MSEEIKNLNTKISVSNLEEFQTLIQKAQKESVQLKETIAQIHDFDFKVELKT